MATSEDARLKQIRAVSFALVIAGALLVFVLRTRGIRFIGPLPTLVLIWFPWIAASAIENVVAHATRARWMFWTLGLAIFIGLTIYLRR
jgi:hypothetical protein